MPTRYFALILGMAFLLIGVMGFIPGLVTHPAAHDAAGATMQHGYLLGLFPVNALHNIVHLLFGLWGVVAFASLAQSRIYAQSVAIIYAVLPIIGLMPAPVNTLWGWVPVHGHDIWLHAVIALAAAYFGWLAGHAWTRSTSGGDYPHGHTPVTR